LGISGILAWGVGFIPQNAWACFEKDGNLVETIRASRVAYAKPLKIAWGVRNWTLESFLFFCVRVQGTTKDVFVANVIQLALEHCQLFTHHHATKVIEVAAKYCTNMGIPCSSSFSEE